MIMFKKQTAKIVSVWLNIINTFCFSDEEPGPIARMPTDELMNSEVAILTGK